MEYRNPFERIENVKKIVEISKKICEDYTLGNYIDYKLLEIGYEDFNYILKTEQNNYMIKIFNTERDYLCCNRLVNNILTAIKNGINHPMLFLNKFGEYIYNIEIDNVKLRLIVMEYISGNNLYTLNKDLNERQIKDIAKTACKINNTNFKTNEVFYDEWTITNIELEYDKKKEYIEEIDKKEVEEIVEKIKTINFKDFKYCYIHGDIIKANIIEDEKSKKLFYIDFSALNFLPRIIEVVTILLGDCLTDTKETTVEKMKCFLQEYNRINKLEKIELDNLCVLLNALAAMYIIQTSYIKNCLKGDYVENEYWLNQGRKYLKMKINNKDIMFLN